MTLQRLADEITDELQKIGVGSTRVGLNTVWRWKKGIHAPDAVHTAMLKRVMSRWDRRRS